MAPRSRSRRSPKSAMAAESRQPPAPLAEPTVDTSTVTAPEPASPRRRGRPRSHDCHQAILTATVELLENGRYADLTMEGVAARAQVAKQTLYKWWPSKAKLAMEAYAARMF